MFAGHLGAALVLGRAGRRVNAGVLVTAALLLDILLWLFILLGWESVTIPADFAATHQPQFAFPYSHGLLAALLWSALVGALALALYSHLGADRVRAALLVAAAVFSHWLLDALVHRPELPLVGSGSTSVGLSLWNQLPVALGLEAAIVVAGLWLFLKGSALARGRRIGLAALVLLTLVFTLIGMTAAPPPPSAIAMAASSLVTLAIVCALTCWLGAKR